MVAGYYGLVEVSGTCLRVVQSGMFGVCLAALMQPVAIGGVDDFAGKRIAEIRFVPERQPFEQTEVPLLIPFRQGDLLRTDLISKAIEQLFATGRYTDIVADASMSGDGVTITFQTELAWFVGSINVIGVPEPPNRGEMLSATGLELGAEFQQEQAERAVVDIEQRLQANGFQQPKVRTELDHDAVNHQVHVRFVVEPGKRAKLTEPILQGDPQRSARDVLKDTRWKKYFGLGPYHLAIERRVQQGLERVRRGYQNRSHLMAKVELDRLEQLPGRVRPHVIIEAGPKIEVRATGMKLSRGKLRELVPIYTERSVDRELLAEGSRNILEYLRGKGYFDATVSFDSRGEQNGVQVIEYSLTPGQKRRLTRVSIAGNRYFDEETLRERMSVTAATKVRYRNGRYSTQMLERDLDSIRELYMGNGFLNVNVTSDVGTRGGDKDADFAVRIQIEEGPQWFVASVDLSGVDLKFYQYLLSSLQTQIEQPFSQSGVAADRGSILSFYFDSGYPEARLEAEVTEDAEPHRVHVRFRAEEGRRNFVKGVLVSGLSTTKPGLVDQRIRLAPGDPLSQSEIMRAQRRLYDLGIFARVDTAVENPEGRERNKIVSYEIEEARRYSMTWGFGLQAGRIGTGSSYLGSPAGAAGVSPRISTGISRANFLGMGHTGSLNFFVSSIQQRGVLNYLAPQFRNRDNLSLSLSAIAEKSNDVRTFNSQRLEGASELIWRRSRSTTIQYRYVFRRVNLSELKISPELIPLWSRPVRVGIVSSTLIFDRRDDPVESHRGHYNSLDLGFASPPFGSEFTFVRQLFRNSTYHRIGREFVLARSILFGTISPFGRISDNPLEFPLSEKFFAGGASSHRAFPENQAGPRDLVTGFPIGGRAILMHNLEARFPLLGDNVGAVLFWDFGNVYSEFSKISFRVTQRDLTDFDYAVQAVGLGFRLRTPVGPIRLDLSYGLNSPRFFGYQGSLEDLIAGRGRQVVQRIHPFQFHFSLGQTF